MSDGRLSSGVDHSTFGRSSSTPGGMGRATGPVTYDLASWGVRAAAWIIDLLLIVVTAAIVFSLGISLFESDPDEQRRIIERYAYPIALVITALYSPLMMMRAGERNGQTFGKQAMKIRVVSETGKPVNFGVGVMREVVGRIVPSMLTLGLYTPIDYLWPLWDRSRQCLHDKVAKTRVVRVGPPVAAATAKPLPQEPPHSSGLPAAPPPRPHRDEDDRPVRDGWLPPSAGS